MPSVPSVPPEPTCKTKLQVTGASGFKPETGIANFPWAADVSAAKKQEASPRPSKSNSMSFLRVVSLATIATGLAIDNDQKVLNGQDQQVLSGQYSLSLLKRHIDTAAEAPDQQEGNLALVSQREDTSPCQFYVDCTTCLGPTGQASKCVWTITADPAQLFNQAAGSCRAGPSCAPYNGGFTCGSVKASNGNTVSRPCCFSSQSEAIDYDYACVGAAETQPAPTNPGPCGSTAMCVNGMNCPAIGMGDTNFLCCNNIWNQQANMYVEGTCYQSGQASCQVNTAGGCTLTSTSSGNINLG
eukprot:g68608.t1